jgi:hypothetical protein
MANNLSKTNIVNGNIIEAADITQIIDALTATEDYNITISGSFAFSGSTTGSGWFENAVSASRSISSSYADFADTASYATFAVFADAATSASFAITASYALTSSIPSEISASTYDDITRTDTTVKFLAGSGETSLGGPPHQVVYGYSELASYTPSDLGNKVFITITTIETASTTFISSFAPPNITFESVDPQVKFHFHIIYHQ